MGSMIEIPQLNLALEGFSPLQAAQIGTWLAEFDQESDASVIRWQISGLHSADALLRALESPQNSGINHELTRVLWPSEISQATEPTQSARERFKHLLLDLNEPLQAAATRYVMGSLLVERHTSGDVMKGLWHVQVADALLAVVDFDRVTLAIRPQTRYLLLEQAHWAMRSEQAQAPSHFLHFPIEHIMWDYAKRSGRQLLPLRYTQREITLRRYPRLPLTCLNDAELALLTLLRQMPQSLVQISRQLKLPIDQISHLLGALYFSGAITTRKLGFWARMGQRLAASPRLPFGYTQTKVPVREEPKSATSSVVLGQTPQTTC